MKDYCVYKHTSPSGKVYIGITKLNPEMRWKNGRGYRNQKYFSCAIEKYGWENFSHEILFSKLTREEASRKESELIAFYKSNQREFGYNIESGGFNGVVNDDMRRKMSESHKGVKLSEEHRKRIGESLKGRKFSAETLEKIRVGNIGKKASEEARAKMSKSHTGLKPSEETVAKWKESNQSMFVAVDQKDLITDEIINHFASSMDAFRLTGIDSSSIVKCCRGKRKSAGGFKWQYATNI